MKEIIPNGTRVLLDRRAIPTPKHKPYSSTNSTISTVDGTIEKAVEWSPGEWRYDIKIGENRTVFPINRKDFEVVENQNPNK